VIAYKEKDRNVTGRQAPDAPGKFPLLCLARLTALISITAKENKVYLILPGIIYNLVKSRQEIKQTGG
jgi:hypothetical protein